MYLTDITLRLNALIATHLQPGPHVPRPEIRPHAERRHAHIVPVIQILHPDPLNLRLRVQLVVGLLLPLFEPENLLFGRRRGDGRRVEAGPSARRRPHVGAAGRQHDLVASLIDGHAVT